MPPDVECEIEVLGEIEGVLEPLIEVKAEAEVFGDIEGVLEDY